LPALPALTTMVLCPPAAHPPLTHHSLLKLRMILHPGGNCMTGSVQRMSIQQPIAAIIRSPPRASQGYLKTNNDIMIKNSLIWYSWLDVSVPGTVTDVDDDCLFVVFIRTLAEKAITCQYRLGACRPAYYGAHTTAINIRNQLAILFQGKMSMWLRPQVVNPIVASRGTCTCPARGCTKHYMPSSERK